MSAVARLVKGTSLSMGIVATTILGQIISVPIYLTHWDAPTYGVWLIFQGLLGYHTLISVAFQQYIYAEVLQCGRDARQEVQRIYWAALAMGYVIAAVEFAAILVFAPNAISALMAGQTAVSPETIVQLLVLFAILNLILMPFGAITSQTMTIHGFYPRSAAWGLFHVAAIMCAPVFAVVLGAELKIAGLAQLAAHSVSALLMISDISQLARRYGLLTRTQIDWRMGSFAAIRCLPLAGRTFIDSFRQQGFRILLGAYAGTTAVTDLATTRTFANVLHQGISTITAPLMPELMRYVINRDQDRMEGAFAIVWLCLFVLLIPSVLILCLLGEPVFIFWTRGAVEFDPVLFLTLLTAVLTYATGQPASAILQGQNRISWLISISAASAVVLAAFSVLMIPHFGLRGAGFALLMSEFCAATLTVVGAAKALRTSKLDFPRRSVALVATAVCLVFGLSLLAVTFFETRPIFMALPIAANMMFAALYWRTIPTLARSRILSILAEVRARLPCRVSAGASGPK